MKFHAATMILVVIVSGCAQTGPPRGGPEDTTPPQVIEASPAPGSTEVDTSTTLRLRFDEAVSKATLRAAFGLSPPPQGTVSTVWKGEKQVTLHFNPGLRPDRTYALTIGTQLTDAHGNGLDETYVLAFSTGTQLDLGRLEGRVYTDGEASGWNIAGYALADSVTEPDPSSEAPDATTQTARDGHFELSNLRMGRWRVFAFKDQDADRLWTPWLEQLAVPPFDVEAVEDSTVTPRLLILRPAEPRVSPQPQRVTAQRRDLFLLRFDRKPRDLDASFALAALPAAPADNPYPASWRTDPADLEIAAMNRGYRPVDSTMVQVGLSRPVEGDAVGLRVFGSFGARDTLDTVLVVDLTTAAREDTLRPVLAGVNPAERSRIHPGNNEIRFDFSEAVRLGDPRGIYINLGSADTLYPVVKKPYPNQLNFSVARETPGGALTVTLLGAAISDLSGNTLRDSVLTYRYAWLPVDSLGAMSGRVRALVEGAAVHLKFEDAAGVQLPMELIVPGDGGFTLRDLPAGRWLIHGWQDVSGTLSWYEGSAKPFIPSDPVVAPPDTVTVRARWESGGVEIIFP